MRQIYVYMRCLPDAPASNKPADLKKGLIFITQGSNVNLSKKTMINVPKKHIGIFIESDVWQYKNAFRHVIKQTPGDFAVHYKGKGYETFYGEFPI